MDRHRPAQELQVFSPCNLFKAIIGCWNLSHWRICRTVLLSGLASPSGGSRLWRTQARLRTRLHWDGKKSRPTRSMQGSREQQMHIRRKVWSPGENRMRSLPQRPQHRDWRSGRTLSYGGVWMWSSTSTIRKCSTSFPIPGWHPHCRLLLVLPSCFSLGPRDLLLHQSLMLSSGKTLHRSGIYLHCSPQLLD